MEFEKRIAKMERELTALKTAASKSTATLKTVSKGATLTIPMTLETASGAVFGSKMGIVAITATNGAYLAQMTVDNIQSGRIYSVTRRPASGNTTEFVFAITNGNDSDYERAQSGSFDVNEAVTITATSDFTMTISYEDFE